MFDPMPPPRPAPHAKSPSPSGASPLAPLVYRLLRALGGLLVAGAAAVLALGTFFIGTVAATGCFIECSSPPDPVGGTLLLLGAGGLAGVAATSLGWAVTNRRIGELLRLVGLPVGAVAIVLILVVLPSAG